MAHTLVTFHAHPDDESLLTAGVMAKAAAEGHRVVLVVATAGEVGEAADAYRDAANEDLGATRRAELARSAAILGVARVVELGYRDSGSTPRAVDSDAAGEGEGEHEREREPTAGHTFAAAPVDEAAERLAAILREEHADVLTTYDPNGGYGHPDHLQVHAVGRRAAELAGTPVVLEATINRDLMTMGVQLAGSLGYEVPDDFQPESFDAWFMPASELTHAVDVSAFLAQKRSSMAAHESQSTTSGEGTRSIAVFLSLPDEYFAMAFGTEWFIERGRAPGVADGQPITDVFATLAGSDG
jgi:LmbE family N-acetylglucosaminyl deacetylase